MKEIGRTGPIVVAILIGVVVAGIRLSRGAGPCRPYAPVPLTGTLVDVRRDETALPSDDPIFSVLPRSVCLVPLGGSPEHRVVDVSDCYDPQLRAVFLMGAP